MPSRRAFIQGGIAISALAARPLRSGAAVAAPGIVIVERGLAAGTAFGSSFARWGFRVTQTPADIGGLWMYLLEPGLRREPLVIAGLMRAGPLFCLEVLARDYGLGPVFRIRHKVLGDGHFEHTAEAGSLDAEWTSRLSAAGSHWPGWAAAFLAEPTDPATERKAVPLPDTATARSTTGDTVYSWLLAPELNRRALLPAG